MSDDLLIPRNSPPSSTPNSSGQRTAANSRNSLDSGASRPGFIARARHKLRREGSAYSTVTTLFALMLAASMALDGFNPQRSLSSLAWLSAGVTSSLVLALVSLYLGKSLSRWVGLALVAAHTVVTALIVGFSTTTQSITANLQEMPLMAMYLAWFYSARTARAGLYGSLAVIITVGVTGPGSYFDTNYSVHEVIRLIMFMVLSLEIGILWRRSSATESNVDELTGAHSRKELRKDLERELRRSARYGHVFTVVVIDLDDFKLVNDTRGHDAGDHVLKRVVAHLESGVRCTDTVYRYGGDEFVLLLADTPLAAAETLLDRLAHEAPHGWSWGGAQAQADDSVVSVLARADRAMFVQKHDSRAGR